MVNLVKLAQELSTLSMGGIVGFFNTRDKRLLLVESSNILLSFSRILIELSNNTFKSRSFIDDWNSGLIDDIKLLAQVDANDYLNRYLLVAQLLDEYKDYELYRRVKFTKFRIEKALGRYDDKYVVLVNLVNWNNKITIGAFNHGTDAEEFLNRYYSTKEVTRIIYASNKPTREYLQSEMRKKI